MDDLGVKVVAIRREDGWSAHRDGLRLEDLFLRRYFRLLGYVGGSFLYARDLDAPAPGLVYVNADLTSRWLLHSAAGSVGTVQLLPQGPAAADGRYALHFSGESSAWFDVPLGDHPELVFSVAQDPRYDQEDLDGDLSVSAGTIQAKSASRFAGGRELFQTFFSGRDFRNNWKEIRVDLAEFSGQTVHLEIRLKPRNAGESPGLAIADPVIYASETTEPLPETGERLLFNTATQRHPVAVRFEPEQVHPGMSYQLEVPELAGQFVDLLFCLNGGPPTEAPRFRRLDARGRATVLVPRDFGPLPAAIDMRGVRRSGDTLWLAASGRIEVAM
jgi:hypothetical protein